MRNLLRQTLTVTSRGPTGSDSYGNATMVTASTATALGVIYVEGEFDNHVDRDQVTLDAWGFVAADVTVDKNDRITDPDGNVYEVIDVRAPVRATTGVVHHKEIRLRRVYD